MTTSASIPGGILVALLALGCAPDADADGTPFDAGPGVTDGAPDLDDASAALDAGTEAGPPDLGGDAGPRDAGPPPSCAGSCGRLPPGGGCSCGDGCGAAGNCCDDYEPQCGLEAMIRAELSGGHLTRSYTGARDLMYGITGSVDVQDGQVECIYTGVTAAADGTRTPGGLFNTEHVWPRSAGEPPGSAGDLYNLRTCLEEANGQRGSHPFGETVCEGASCDYERGGSELGVDVAATPVWQVRAETQGDIARSMFYFAIRYGLDIPASEETTLRAWHAADPPSPAELARVLAIEAVQGNRNAFADRPELVAQIPDF